MTSRLRSGSAWLLVLALVASTLGVVAWVDPAAAANPPAFVTTWGRAGNGDGFFDFPTGMAVDADDDVYVADGGNNRVQKFTSAGAFITSWGEAGSEDGQFDFPTGVGI